MLFVRERAGVVKLLDLRVLFEEGGDTSARRVVLLHAHGERLRAAQGQPRVEGREYRARAVLYELKPLGVALVIQHDHAADAVRVAVQILRRRVDDDVHAELYGALQVRRHERVGAHHARSGPVRPVRDALQVRYHLHGRGRRRYEADPGGLFDGLLDVPKVGRVYVR